jgi:hemerythrin superfamily protein
MNATQLLKQDHRTVESLFTQFEETPASAGEQRQQLMDQIAEELEVHAQIEEEVFYPAVQRVTGTVGEARSEHGKVRTLIGDAEGRDPASSEFATKVRELKAAVEHHVAEEEHQMFVDAERCGHAELERLGHELEERKRTLKESMIQRGIRGMKLAAKKIV